LVFDCLELIRISGSSAPFSLAQVRVEAIEEFVKASHVRHYVQSQARPFWVSKCQPSAGEILVPEDKHAFVRMKKLGCTAEYVEVCERN
jgi:hypothetical protein